MNPVRTVIARTLCGSPLILALLLTSGCASLDRGAAPRLTATEKMVWSTYAIETRRGLATCVLVNRSGPRAHDLFPVLITSAHVLASAPHGQFFIAARVPDKDGKVSVVLLEFQPAAGTEPAYVRHPEHDIAAIELPIPPELAKELALPSFLDENAIGSRGDAPHVGDEVTLLGFPQIFPGTEGAFPVLRAGRIASYSAGPRSGWSKFLINTNVYPGDSGAPVFAAHGRGRGLHLIGMVTERIGPRDGVVPLAIGIDARIIRETLQLLNARTAAVAPIPPTKRALEDDKPTPPTVKLIGAPKWMR